MPRYEETPPSYSDAVILDKLRAEVQRHDEELYGDQIERSSSTEEEDSESVWEREYGESPPVAKWLVQTTAEPSMWKLMSGPLMSNATTAYNNDPLHKRRYAVLFPPGYEDVYLHKSTWYANAATLPPYHVEIYSCKNNGRYEPEPIIVLGPTEGDDDLMEAFAQSHAALHVSKVFARVEQAMSQTSRLVTFCEGEFFSWDWKRKTSAARHDMQVLINKARKELIRDASFVVRLDQYLDFVGKAGDTQLLSSMEFFRGSIKDSGRRLRRMRV